VEPAWQKMMVGAAGRGAGCGLNQPFTARPNLYHFTDLITYYSPHCTLLSAVQSTVFCSIALHELSFFSLVQTLPTLYLFYLITHARHS